jgi:hypothetical protein
MIALGIIAISWIGWSVVLRGFEILGEFNHTKPK